MKCFFFVFIFFIGSILFGQNTFNLDNERKNTADSLTLIIKNTTDLSKKAAHILKLSKLLRNSDKKKSRDLAKSVLTMPLEKDEDSLKSIALLRIGVSYFKEKKDSIALIHFLKMDSLYQISNDIYPSLIMSKVYRAEISKFTFTKAGILQARQFLNEGLELAKNIKNEKYINLMTYRIGGWMGFYSQVELPKVYLDSSKIYLNKALLYYKKTNNHEYISKIYFSLASVASSRKDFKLAGYYYNLRLSEIEKTKDSIDLGNAHAALGGFYRRIKKYEKALKHLNKAEIIQKKYGIDDIDKKISLVHTLALTYNENNNFKAALNYFKREIILRDSLFEQNNAKQVLQLETKYQTEKKEQEIVLLKSQNETVEAQKKNQRNILLAGISIVSFAGVFLFILYRNRKKTNTKLRELDIAKTNFFANISHEFRTPLTLITNPIDETLSDETISSKKREQFVMAKRNSERLLSLVNQLLDLSKIDAGQLKLCIQKGNLLSLISGIGESFHYSAQQKSISYELNIEKSNNEVWFDKDALEKITINLVSNAIKYTPKNGQIICKSFIENDKLHLEVKNTGVELTQIELDNIFIRFYQTDEQNLGTGIGLALVKELVELHKGSIRVNSNEDEVSFFVEIPIDKEHFKNEIFVDTSEVKTTFKAQIFEDEDVVAEEFKDSDKPILLIVEDNADVRTLLKQNFENDYNILTAPNGQVGIDLALEQIPDIIISDIMMPVKDGVTLANTLKTNELTSHIPIILLTAKAGDENEIEGIKTGADDYITKPFNSKLLKTKVSNLINVRHKLQSRYSQEIVLTPKDIAVTNLDEVFLNKVQEVLETNLVESSFSIEDFSKAVGMSRMQLHRKIKALTGLSASEFVRSQRLKLAAELLKTSDINISQVGYSVGFNDHSYFAKCFKEAYSCTPTEFAKRS